MSVQAALQFIQQVRQDETLQAQLQVSAADGKPRCVLEIAAAEGFVFSLDDLRTAHRHDWAMRRLHYAKSQVASNE